MARRRPAYADKTIRHEARIERHLTPSHRRISVVVGPESGQGWRLDRYLMAALRSYSRTLIGRWLRHGYGRFNGRAAKPSQRVHGGDRCDLVIPHPPPPPAHQTTPDRLHVLYEDDGVLACNKPPGQLAHPAGRVLTGTLLNQIQLLLQDRGHDPLAARLVNRIDRDTSGIVLATCDSDSHRRLCQALREGAFTKEYLAICHGVPDPAHGHWREPICDPIGPHTIARRCAPEGAPSHTEYRVIEASAHRRYSLIRLVLHTGRQHQIRVHAAHHGHPLLGDWVYGAPCHELPGQALHSASLDFVHPLNGAAIHVEAPLIGAVETLWLHLAGDGTVSDRPLSEDERTRLGLDTPNDEDLPGGWRRPSWLDDESFAALRRGVGE